MIFNPNVVFSSEAKQVQESSFNFLERSTWNRFRIVRDTVTDWANEMLPDNEFISKIKSKNDITSICVSKIVI